MTKAQAATTPATPPATSGVRRGLECSVGKARVAVPIEAVDQVLDYEVSPPPPLARRWVGGLAVYGRKVLLSVALIPSPTAPQGRRSAKGVLLLIPHSEVGLVLEVASVVAFVQAEVQGERPPQAVKASKLPSWIAVAKTKDLRPIGWIDIDAMVRELVGVA